MNRKDVISTITVTLTLGALLGLGWGLAIAGAQPPPAAPSSIGGTQ